MHQSTANERWAQHTNEVNASSCIRLRYFLLEDLGPIDIATCGRDSCDQYFYALCFEDLFDAAPVAHLKGCDGWPNCDRVKAKEAVAEYDGILGRLVCIEQIRVRGKRE